MQLFQMATKLEPYFLAYDLEEMKKIGDIYINFKAYSVQAGDMTALEAWNKVK